MGQTRLVLPNPRQGCLSASRPMKLVTYFLLGSLVFSIFRIRRALDQCKNPQERYFLVRTTIFWWLLGFLFLNAFLFLPNKGRVLLLLPVLFVGVAGARMWTNARTRLRRQASEKIDLEKMKRAN